MTSSIFKSAIYRDVEELSATTCLDIARRCTKLSDVEVIKVTMATFSETPVGFLGDHYKVNIRVRYRDKTKEAGNKFKTRDVPLFVKTKPRNETHTKFLESLGVFEKERLFFTTLFALLRKYMKETEEPWLPNCVFANSRALVLEDLSCQGYEILKNRSVMDYDHLVETFRTLARFHATSIITEELEGRRLGRKFRLNEEYPEVFQETFWTHAPGNSGKQIVRSGVNGLVSLSKLMTRLRRGSPMLVDVLVKYLEESLFDEVSNLVGASKEFRNVMTHGDLWQNNVLFRYDNASTRPAAVRLIDFQLLRYTPPAHDFLITLYLNSTRSFRRSHFTDIAHVYHSTLAESLARYSLDVEALFGWKEFQASLQHYHVLGLTMTCLYFPTTLLPGDVAAEVFADGEAFAKFMLEDRSPAAMKSFAKDAVYRERIGEVVEELAEFVAERSNSNTSNN